MGAVFIVFYQTCYRNLQSELVFHCFANCPHLTDTPISDYQVGQLAPFLHEVLISAIHHFAHGGIVIGPFYGFDYELLIIAFARFGFLKHHTTGYCILALQIGIIETINP